MGHKGKRKTRARTPNRLQFRGEEGWQRERAGWAGRPEVEAVAQGVLGEARGWGDQGTVKNFLIISDTSFALWWQRTSPFSDTSDEAGAEGMGTCLYARLLLSDGPE